MTYRKVIRLWIFLQQSYWLFLERRTLLMTFLRENSNVDDFFSFNTSIWIYHIWLPFYTIRSSYVTFLYEEFIHSKFLKKSSLFPFAVCSAHCAMAFLFGEFRELSSEARKHSRSLARVSCIFTANACVRTLGGAVSKQIETSSKLN